MLITRHLATKHDLREPIVEPVRRLSTQAELREAGNSDDAVQRRHWPHLVQLLTRVALYPTSPNLRAHLVSLPHHYRLRPKAR